MIAASMNVTTPATQDIGPTNQFDRKTSFWMAFAFSAYGARRTTLPSRR